MKVGKNEKEQVKRVKAWNKEHQIGIDVIVTLDDKSEKPTKTISEAYMLGKCGDYPGHTAVIRILGISGCYRLDRVRKDGTHL